MKIVLFYITIISALFLSCAKTGSISGGPKDEDPPVLLKADPPLNSTNIEPEKITLDFDEFIDIKDLTKSLIVSPPLESKPETTLKGKKLVLEISDTLNKNTTYSLNFGNGLKDYNEGNPIPNFAYVFSTGSFIDSMAVTGRVLDAYTQKPIDTKKSTVSVLLYKNLTDTAFTHERALYVSICDEEGYFTVNNISEGTYNIFALTDVNNSYSYDSDKELIAFADSAFTINAKMFDSIPAVPQIHTDSLSATDSTLNDSIFEQELLYALNVNLFLFKEKRFRQKLAVKERKEQYKITMIFNETQPYFNYWLMDDSLNTSWYIEEKSNTLDTFHIWITDSTIYRNDSIWLMSNYLMGDDDSTYMKTDTILFKYYKRKPKKASAVKGKGSRPLNKDAKQSFEITTYPNKGKKINLNHHFITFIFEKPLLDYDTSKIHLFKTIDTLTYRVPVNFETYDSLPRHLITNFKPEPGLAYNFELLPGAFTNIYHESLTDTTNLKYRSENEDYYGILNFSVTNIEGNVLLQMYGKKSQKVFKEISLNEDMIWRIDFIPPGEYDFRAIYDINNNQKWDEGAYKDKRQPEKVKYYHQSINIRSNWEIEESWDLNNIVVPVKEAPVELKE